MDPFVVCCPRVEYAQHEMETCVFCGAVSVLHERGISRAAADADRAAKPPTSRKQRAAANRKAMRVFHASFPVPCKIHIAEVWRCQRV